MKSTLLIAALLALAAAPVLAEQPGSQDDGPHMRRVAEFYFGKMDTNGDGFVTRDEVRAYADKMFDEADANRDGKLTIDELVNQKMHERDEFRDYRGKNTSDTSNATKVKSN